MTSTPASVPPVSPFEFSATQNRLIGELARKMSLVGIVIVLFGALQMSIALASYRLGAKESIVNSVLRIASFTSGPMLGLYLLGILTNVSQWPALGGFFGGLGVVSLVYLRTEIYWPWYAAIGAIATFVVGWALDQLFSFGSRNTDSSTT